MNRRLPVVTAMVVIIALIVAASPALQSMLVYDRLAIAHGQLWRLFTGNWVHFSLKHLLYDAGVFAIAGWMIENRGQKNFRWLCALSPLLIGVSLFRFAPGLTIFGGLSGMATAAVTFWALNGWAAKDSRRLVYLMTLSLTAGKILFEFWNGGFVFMDFGDAIIKSVPLNHLVGALSACLVYTGTTLTARASAGSGPVSSAAFSPANLSR